MEYNEIMKSVSIYRDYICGEINADDIIFSDVVHCEYVSYIDIDGVKIKIGIDNISENRL